jgi:hypothetical protein
MRRLAGTGQPYLIHATPSREPTLGEGPSDAPDLGQEAWGRRLGSSDILGGRRLVEV